MNSEAKNLLVGVNALSKKLCYHQIAGHLAYATNQNLIGRVIDGYSPNAQDICLLTRKPALALCEAQNYLTSKGLGLYIYDAYRLTNTSLSVKKFITQTWQRLT